MRFLVTINNYKADPTGWIGSGIMFLFALIAGYRWHDTGTIFFALLVLRDLAASWFLLTRNINKQNSVPITIEILAYVSSAIPFIYFGSSHSIHNGELISTVLAIIGFSISTLALFDLGQSFGVSPANRGIVRTGLYRYIKHPMYLGYVISEFGFILLNPFNIIIWSTSAILYFFRTKFENKALLSN